MLNEIQDDQVEAMTEAVLEADLSSIRRIAQSTPPDCPYFRHFNVLDQVREMMHGERSLDMLVDSLCEILNDPPQHSGLLQSCLGVYCSLVLLQSRNICEAQRALELMRNLQTQGDSKRLLAFRMFNESRAKRVNGEFRLAYEFSSRALKLLGESNSSLWLRVKIDHLDDAINNLCYAEAWQDLRDLERHPAPETMLEPTGFRKAKFYLAIGRYQTALKILDELPGADSSQADRNALECRLKCYLKLNRKAQFIHLMETRTPERGPFYWAWFEAAHGNWSGAKRRLTNFFKNNSDDAFPEAREFLAIVLMNCGQLRQARIILEALDRYQSIPKFFPAWTQLLQLEGREDEAVRLFRQILQRVGSAFFNAVIEHMPSLSVLELNHLWSRAVDQPVSDRPPESGVFTPVHSALHASANQDAPEFRQGPRTLFRLVGASAQMVRVRELIDRFAKEDGPVLITGEPGTGKDLIARNIHAKSSRALEPFIKVNCAYVSEALLEAELFGYAKGAFAGANQDRDGVFVSIGKGTVFLDEITHLSPRLQAAFKRIIENGVVTPMGSGHSSPVQVRIIAAAHRPLDSLVARKEFRFDLYYQLARLRIAVAPLRDRPEDLLPLVEHFLEERYREQGFVPGQDLLDSFERRTWPGNVQELRNEIERLAILAGDQKVLSCEMATREDVFDFDSVAQQVSPEKDPSESTSSSTRIIAVSDLPTSRESISQQRPLNRLKQLKKLFEQHREMTRGQAAAFMGCALNTAAKDLRLLEKEGFICRVWTSPSPRTSYFEIASVYGNGEEKAEA